jgi:hypothetical protein
LLSGDLFTQIGDGPALTERDIVGPAISTEDLFRFSSLNPGHGPDDPQAGDAGAAHDRADARSLPLPATARRRCADWPAITTAVSARR